LKAPNLPLLFFKKVFWHKWKNKSIAEQGEQSRANEKKPSQHLTMPFLLKDTEKRYALPFEELV
jgi:hypothetical protein